MDCGLCGHGRGHECGHGHGHSNKLATRNSQRLTRLAGGTFNWLSGNGGGGASNVLSVSVLCCCACHRQTVVCHIHDKMLQLSWPLRLPRQFANQETEYRMLALALLPAL